MFRALQPIAHRFVQRHVLNVKKTEDVTFDTEAVGDPRLVVDNVPVAQVRLYDDILKPMWRVCVLDFSV